MPIGLFLLVHLFTNGLAMANPHAFDVGAQVLDSMPALFAAEIILIYLPLLYHGLYGLFIVAYSRFKNMPAYAYPRNAYYWWQRFTGIVLILFIGWHAITIRFGVFNLNFWTEHDPTFTVMAHTFNPLVFAAYIIGVIATSYHFCNGLWAFGVTWGVTIGPKAQRSASRFWMASAVVMAALWLAIATTFFLASKG